MSYLVKDAAKEKRFLGPNPNLDEANLMGSGKNLNPLHRKRGLITVNSS